MVFFHIVYRFVTRVFTYARLLILYLSRDRLGSFVGAARALEYIMSNISQLTTNDSSQDEKLAYSIDFTTIGFSPTDQFEIFRAAHQGVMDLYLSKSQDASFPAHQTVWNLGKLALAHTVLPGKGYAYRWRHMAKATLDHWYLVVPIRSSAPDGFHEERAALPGLHCLAKPYEAESEDDGALTLYIPRDLFSSTSALDHMLDVQFDGGLGSLLADYLVLLNRSLPDLSITELPYVVEATRCLIAVCVGPSRDRVAEAQSPIDSILVERARRLIGQRLGEPSLTPDVLCVELGVSRSRLYRIFEPFGGISSYIRRQRLLRTRDALSDSSDRRSIARIAEQWGFFDASAYSRTFRHEFGISPKEARMRGWEGNGYVVGDGKPPVYQQAESLSHLLRGLSA